MGSHQMADSVSAPRAFHPLHGSYAAALIGCGRFKTNNVRSRPGGSIFTITACYGLLPAAIQQS